MISFDLFNSFLALKYGFNDLTEGCTPFFAKSIVLWNPFFNLC